MKTLKLLSVLFVAVLVSMVATSCGDDDDEKNEGQVPALLKGFWQMNEADFEQFKNIMLTIQEDEEDDESGEMMIKALNEIDNILFEVNDDNLFMLMHVNPSKLSAKLGVEIEKEYIAMPYIEKGELVVKTSSNNAGALYEKDSDSEGEELILKYSNLTKSSVDVTFYTDDEVYPTFSTTLYRIDDKFDYIYVWDLKNNGGDDDDDDDDDGDDE